MVKPVWLSDLPRGRLQANAPLAKRTWLKVGGEAEWLFTPEDVHDLVSVMKQYPADAPLFLLGNGTNTLIRDGGLEGLVVQLGAGFAQISSIDPHRIQAGARVRSIKLAQECARLGLGGMSFLAGIPGTVGGALAMNAGAHGGETFDHLESLQWMNRGGQIRHYPKTELSHGYRFCSLRGGIFLSAIFCCPKRETSELEEEIVAVQNRRAETQPVGEATGGSTFVNPMEASPVNGEVKHAWQWIDEAGCRGLRVGGAEVSEKHCNFLINRGGATAADFESLAEEVRTRVRENFGVKLEWEIRREGRSIAEVNS